MDVAPPLPIEISLLRDLTDYEGMDGVALLRCLSPAAYAAWGDEVAGRFRALEPPEEEPPPLAPLPPSDLPAPTFEHVLTGGFHGLRPMLGTTPTALTFTRTSAGTVETHWDADLHAQQQAEKRQQRGLPGHDYSGLLEDRDDDPLCRYVVCLAGGGILFYIFWPLLAHVLGAL